VGKLAYVVDDQTVGKKGTGTNTVAGTVVQVEATGDRWVWIDVGKVWTSSVTRIRWRRDAGMTLPQ
jgi:hypothetical protein